MLSSSDVTSGECSSVIGDDRGYLESLFDQAFWPDDGFDDEFQLQAGKLESVIQRQATIQRPSVSELAEVYGRYFGRGL